MKTVAILAVAGVLVMGVASLATATHEESEPGDDRSATYVGSTTVMHLLNEDCAETLEEEECPTRIPRGIFSPTCDYSASGNIFTGGLYQNLGGVNFCQIQKSIDNETVQHEQFVRVRYDDIGVFDPQGMVTCPVTSNDATGDVTTWNTEFSSIDSNEWVTVALPAWCDSVGGHDHRTDLNIFNLAADVREGVAIGGAVEGEAFLEVLNPLPGI